MDCVTNGIKGSWYPLSTWLRENGQQALNTETGGGPVDSCVGYLSQQIAYQAANSDGQSVQCTIFGLSLSAEHVALQSFLAMRVGERVC